jgi:hypothetical protein
MIEFITFLFFRVKDLAQLETDQNCNNYLNSSILINYLDITMPEAVTLSLFAFNSSFCSKKNMNSIQMTTYKIFF